MTNPIERVWVALDRSGHPQFAAPWSEDVHEHINDAIDQHVAAIAHCGGWVGLSEDQTIVYVRVLTVGSMPRGTLNASVAALKEAVNAARAAQGGNT